MTAILVMGYPASGKSSITKALKADVVLNRDTVGGKVVHLVQPFLEALHAGKRTVLDNTFLTVESRAPFIAAAQNVGVPIECHWMQTSWEDCQVNALNRMYDRYGQVFMTMADIKAHPEASKDPNMFPITASFVAKKRLEGVKKKGVWEVPCGKPTKDEGFSRIVKVPFHRGAPVGHLKAILLDYDGTLRDDARNHGGQHAYPVKPSEVSVLPNVRKTLARYEAEGWAMFGITTQSGIGKGEMTEAEMVKCLEETNRQAGVAGMTTVWCPHHNFPVSCYCRKPQAGLGVQLIRQYGLDPAQCIYVGDSTSDKTFASRCGFQFAWAADFFTP